jgi:hypothetical protein
MGNIVVVLRVIHAHDVPCRADLYRQFIEDRLRHRTIRIVPSSQAAGGIPSRQVRNHSLDSGVA